MQHSCHELPAVELGVHVHVHHLEVVEQQRVCGHLTRVQGDLHVLLNVSSNRTHVDIILGKINIYCKDAIIAHSLSAVMSLWRS